MMGFGSLEEFQSAAFWVEMILLHALVQILRCEIHFTVESHLRPIFDEGIN